jgi:hypothetical protein
MAFTIALLAAPAAFAQNAPAPASGPLVLEQIHDGWVLAPDVKVTTVDNRTGELAGAYGGRVFDEKLFIGAAGYWLANDRHDSRLAYGGVVVGWQSPEFGRIRFGARGLIGGGSATLGVTAPGRVPIAQPFGGPGDIRFGTTDPRATTPTPAPVPPTNVPPATALRPVRFLARDDFFVVEPTASATIRLAKGMDVSCGIGYRQTAQTNLLRHRLNGPSASLAIQFGW